MRVREKKREALHLKLDGVSCSTRYLVGVSGGRDSVALLHALLEAGFKRLIVCHLNHGLRGRAATGDAHFVQALAGKLGLECEMEKVDVTWLAVESGQSLETAAREARYAFFARVAKRRRCRTLFLGHHAGDQVETFLWNLFRGSGRAGLGGMSMEFIRKVDGVQLRLLRPLLGVWRKEIDIYLKNRGLRFREDESNQDTEFTRNRIRHELIPVLEQVFGRNVSGAVWRAATILREEEDWLAEIIGTEKEAELAVPVLREQPVAQQRRRILAWLRRNGVPELGFDQVEAVRSLLTVEGPAKINLPGNQHARRKSKRLFLEKGKPLPEKNL